MEQQEIRYCSHFLERKRRFCKMKALPGLLVCGEHCPLEVEDSNKGRRIQCPLDGSHTCFATKLESHLKKCNARKKELPVYCSTNVNSGHASELVNKVTIASVSDEELIGLLERIRSSYNELVPLPQSWSKESAVFKQELLKPEYGQMALKHLKQQAAIMGLLESCGLVENNTCFVEFGAGRGQLSYWAVQAVPDKSTCSFVLIDKGSQRHKFENRLKGENEPRIERIRIDIQDLVLGKVPWVANHEGRIVGISKHLCGAATDLSLRCLVENCFDQKNGSLKQCVEGLVLAPCCHHRCSWQSYVGQLFLKSHSFTPRDFQLMCGIASWATCGSSLQVSRNKGCMEHARQTENNVENHQQNNRYIRLDLSPSYREEVGHQCKRIIDFGRLCYLKEHNFCVDMVQYVEPSVSLENIALVARKDKQQLLSS